MKKIYSFTQLVKTMKQHIICIIKNPITANFEHVPIFITP